MSTILEPDAATLRDKVDLERVNRRLAGLESAPDTLNERIGLLCLAGRLEEAEGLAVEAVAGAEESRASDDVLLARIRLATVYQQRGELERARAELTDCVTESGEHGWAWIRGFALHHRGRVAFELGDLDDALEDFRLATILRVSADAPRELVNSSRLAAEEVEARLADKVEKRPATDREGEASGDLLAGSTPS